MSSPGDLDVSRETLARLDTYGELLRKWNPRINLVSKSTLSDLWARHIVDSAQIFDLAPRKITHWADFGSGGGFPGLVIAILAKETDDPFLVTLVESDVRKCAFLRTVTRELDLNVAVKTARIESTPPLDVDVISARALADLSTLLDLSERHISKDGIMLFPKGKNWRAEVIDAQSKWNFDYQVAKSRTNENSTILVISGVSRV